MLLLNRTTPRQHLKALKIEHTILEAIHWNLHKYLFCLGLRNAVVCMNVHKPHPHISHDSPKSIGINEFFFASNVNGAKNHEWLESKTMWSKKKKKKNVKQS